MGVGRIFANTGTSAWWSGKCIPGGRLVEGGGKVKIRTLEKQGCGTRRKKAKTAPLNAHGSAAWTRLGARQN